MEQNAVSAVLYRGNTIEPLTPSINNNQVVELSVLEKTYM